MKSNVSVLWKKRPDEPFTDNKYSRVHKWIFDGGAALRVSSSPQVVPIPMSDAAVVDPEEAFVAALSSCHMLFFLAIAATKNYIVETYEDHATGELSKGDDHKITMTTVTLQPKVIFSGAHIPSHEQITDLHRQAHKNCFLAHSVKSEINIIQTEKILTL